MLKVKENSEVYTIEELEAALKMLRRKKKQMQEVVESTNEIKDWKKGDKAILKRGSVMHKIPEGSKVEVVHKDSTSDDLYPVNVKTKNDVYGWVKPNALEPIEKDCKVGGEFRAALASVLIKEESKKFTITWQTPKSPTDFPTENLLLYVVDEKYYTGVFNQDFQIISHNTTEGYSGNFFWNRVERFIDIDWMAKA